MQQSRWKAIGATLLVVGLIIVALRALGQSRHDFTDLTQAVVATARPLPTPPGSYKGVVWLTKNQLVFLYAANPSSPNGLEEHRLFRYTIGATDWGLLQIPQEGPNAIYAPLFRLPNGKLGFVYSYIDRNEKNPLVNPETAAIYMWDEQTSRFESLYHYTEEFAPAPFTFSPDMSEIVLENGVGAGYHNQLYRVRRDGRMERLFPDYERVKNPSWSPDGRTIAFFGTESYPGDQPTGPLNWPQMGDRLFYPWDLYLMDANTGSAHIILPGIEGNSWIPGWLPHSNLLVFRGRYQNTEGIWVLNTQTQRLTRVWPATVESYWSPDGKQMVVIQHVQENGVERTYPVIVDLPPLE